MASTPLDAGIRKRLVAEVASGLNQSELARAIGRSPGWVNKYIYGVGKATIDDLLAMARFFEMGLLEFVGLPRSGEFTPEERELIVRWRTLSAKGREHFRGLLREMPAAEKEKRQRRRSA